VPVFYLFIENIKGWLRQVRGRGARRAQAGLGKAVPSEVLGAK